MYAPYGKKKSGGILIGLHPSGTTSIKTPVPDTTVHDKFFRCNGCPYPRHGLFCWTDSENCLRTEMDEIYNRSRKGRGVVVAG